MPSSAAATRRSRSHSPAHARRVSGGGAPRRTSGPTRPARPALRVSGGAIAAPRPLVFRIAEVAHALTENRLVDRLVRGKAWIALVGIALLGIVFLQVSNLRTSAGVGRSVERAAALERQNAALETKISRMSAGERIQTLASNLGMIQQPNATTHYLSAGSMRVSRAVRGITEPSTTPPTAGADIGVGTLAETTLSNLAPVTDASATTTGDATTGTGTATDAATTETTATATTTAAASTDATTAAATTAGTSATVGTAGGTPSANGGSVEPAQSTQQPSSEATTPATSTGVSQSSASDASAAGGGVAAATGATSQSATQQTSTVGGGATAAVGG